MTSSGGQARTPPATGCSSSDGWRCSPRRICGALTDFLMKETLRITSRYWPSSGCRYDRGASLGARFFPLDRHLFIAGFITLLLILLSLVSSDFVLLNFVPFVTENPSIFS
ncbi:hypothetical protein GDO78_017329 [Eleutherodactylus coqui]|uniref:Uncharacterized protein n=1 Tax=Eleutherodactylus coqui TaxID=57060 RepID=A0A8J6C2V8_ELECQ|nr:hypothetical protein GDO78_017329 [Eleutherodactylus coqui]